MIKIKLSTEEAVKAAGLAPEWLDFEVSDVTNIAKVPTKDDGLHFTFEAELQNPITGKVVAFRVPDCWKSPEVQLEQLVGGRISFSDHGKGGEKFWMLTRPQVKVDVTDQLTGSEEAD